MVVALLGTHATWTGTSADVICAYIDSVCDPGRVEVVCAAKRDPSLGLLRHAARVLWMMHASQRVCILEAAKGGEGWYSGGIPIACL